MRISIPDELAESLQTQLRGRGTVEMEAAARLAQTLHAPGTRVVLSERELQEIADRLGYGLPIRNKVDLDRALDQTAQITMGNVRLAFTPQQLLQIEERARKVGETPERFIGMVAARVLSDFFNVPPGDQGVFYTPGFDPEDTAEDEEAEEPAPDEEPV